MVYVKSGSVSHLEESSTALTKRVSFKNKNYLKVHQDYCAGDEILQLNFNGINNMERTAMHLPLPK